MGFFKQEYWSVLPFPSPRHLPDPGIKLMFPVPPALQADSFPTEPRGKPQFEGNLGQTCLLILESTPENQEAMGTSTGDIILVATTLGSTFFQQVTGALFWSPAFRLLVQGLHATHQQA